MDTTNPRPFTTHSISPGVIDLISATGETKEINFTNSGQIEPIKEMLNSSSLYHQRRAISNDAAVIAPLWEAFLQQRSQVDPSIILKKNFNYVSYVQQKLQSKSIYGFVLEYGQNKEIVGFLFVYVQDETLSLEVGETSSSPLVSRRLGGAIGMYVQEEHRHGKSIGLLVEAALVLADELKISDIDLLISIEQTGVHCLLERFGFTKAAIQYTKHYDITDKELSPLEQPSSEGIAVKIPEPNLIPLRDPKTQQTVFNPLGEPVFLHPLKNENGEVLRNRGGLPIYPTPLRDPQTQEWIFNKSGELVVCPVVLDKSGNVKEQNGIPLFKIPVYESVEGKLKLKQDDTGNYLFEELTSIKA